MVIRRATTNDLETLVRLNTQVQAIHVAARPDYFRVPETPAVSKWLAGMLDDPSIVVWLATRDGDALGYVLVMTKDRPANPFCHARVTAEIDQIAVEEGERGAGVGRALIEHAIASAEVDNVELNVWAFNDAARAAFERCGFAPRTLTLERVRG